MPADSLAHLDDAAALEINPDIFARNVSALREESPSLAEQVEHTPLPAHWRAVRGLDGAPTFRIEPPDGSPTWLAGTAAPATRARALLEQAVSGQANAALPTVGAGAELALLLRHLPQRCAVYLFESDWNAVAAVLRLNDFSEAIRAGRCVVTPPEESEDFLDGLLDRHPGLMPPGNLVGLPGVSGARLNELHALCERAADRCVRERAERLDVARRALVEKGGSASSPPRVAILALTAERRAHVAGRSLQRSAEGLGWPACLCVIDGPRTVHPLVHCEALAEFAPTLTICLDHEPAALPPPLPGRVCRWYFNAAGAAEAPVDSDVIRLAAGPRVAAALRSTAPDSPPVEFYWGVDDEPAPGGGDLDAEKVVLVGDLPDATAEALGIRQPTHRTLWQTLHEVAGACWQSLEILNPQLLLTTAERKSDMRLRDAALRSQILSLIEHALIPAVILERIKQAVDRQRLTVLTLGGGWGRIADNPQRLADSIFALPDEALSFRPLAAIFAGRADPLSAELLHAGRLGWPLALHWPTTESVTARLGGVLQPDQHFLRFAGAGELAALLESSKKDPAGLERRAQRTSAHLREHHAYRKRLVALEQFIQADAGRTSK